MTLRYVFARFNVERLQRIFVLRWHIYEINYVNMRIVYVNMQLLYINMMHNYFGMQHYLSRMSTWLSRMVTYCDGTYCRFVHIVVGDNMYRPSLHILSSIGTYCRRQQYVPRRPFFPSCIMDDEMCSHASAHIVVGDIMYRDHVHILSPIYYLDK